MNDRHGPTARFVRQNSAYGPLGSRQSIAGGEGCALPAQDVAEKSRRWIGPSPVPDDDARALAGALRLPLVIARVLISRGFTSPEDARRFLTPSLDHLSSHDGLPDLDAACDRIIRAVERGEGMLVHGDYDV